MATQDQYIRTALRVPADLHKAIHGSATVNNRTFNAELIARLQGSFEQTTTEQLTELQLELARSRSDTLAAQYEAMQHSVALMLIGARVPPELLADLPALADMLKRLNTGRKAQLVATAKKMLGQAESMARAIDQIAATEEGKAKAA